MRRIYIPWFPEAEPPKGYGTFGLPYAEVMPSGRPVHPRHLPERTRALLESGDFCTLSDIVVSYVGYLIRAGRFPLPVTLMVDDGETWQENPLDTRGDLLLPLPYKQISDNFAEAGFAWRFHKPSRPANGVSP